MSSENVEIVKGVQPDGVDMVGLFRGPDQADLEAIDPDQTIFERDCEIEFNAGPARKLRTAPSIGIQGLVEQWREWLEPWDSYYVEVEEFIDAGDQVVTLVRVRARTTRDAVAVEHRPAVVWSMRAGKVAALSFYLHRAEALEAAGLPDAAGG